MLRVQKYEIGGAINGSAAECKKRNKILVLDVCPFSDVRRTTHTEAGQTGWFGLLGRYAVSECLVHAARARRANQSRRAAPTFVSLCFGWGCAARAPHCVCGVRVVIKGKCRR